MICVGGTQDANKMLTKNSFIYGYRTLVYQKLEGKKSRTKNRGHQMGDGRKKRKLYQFQLEPQNFYRKIHSEPKYKMF